MKSCLVSSPATVANVVCGFDILGFALNAPCDEMRIRLSDKKGIRIINKDEYNLPENPELNVAGRALAALLEKIPGAPGFDIESKKFIKPGSGIGSSAASASAAVVGANFLLGNPFSKKELVEFAAEGEKLASGARHADNVAPCILGGVTLIRSANPLDIIPLSSPPLFVTVVHPQVEVKTSDARSILKKQLLLKDAIIQWGNIAGLVAGFLKSDYDLISRSLTDHIIEPVRSILIPGFSEVKKKSLEAGSLGGGISGSGPSVFMLSKDEDTAVQVEQAINVVYKKIGIDFHTYVTTINNNGVNVISSGQ